MSLVRAATGLIPALRSLRSRFLLVVFGGVLIPLGLVGFWLTGVALRSGEALLQTRLDATLDQVVSEAGMRYVGLRSQLLDIADDSAIQRMSMRRDLPNYPSTGDDALVVGAPAGNLRASLVAPLRFRLADGSRTWTVVDARVASTDSAGSVSSASGLPTAPGVAVTVPAYSRAGALIGRLESRLSPESLVPVGVGGPSAVGVILHVVDRSTGASLSALPFDPALIKGDYFDLGGEAWLVRRRSLEEPALAIAAVGPLGGYTVPFEAAARTGVFALFTVAFLATALATWLTRKVTRPLEELASATHAVAAGDLDRRVSEDTSSEVGRVGRAFNAMAESLRTTIRQLSQREALVAVGEFASSLAHEIRNPLTSIRIDLQRVEEKLPADSPLRVQLERALREVQRLDRTVGGALRVARSGSISPDIIDLRLSLHRAIEVARPAFDERGAALDQIEMGGRPLPIRGDDAALEQLFLNILLNAGQALDANGEAGVKVWTEDDSAQVDIWDSGSGISADELTKVFDPFFSTKRDGTGLGLSIAKQIVSAHLGTIQIDSTVDSGTTVSIKFPLAKQDRISSVSYG